MSKNLDVSLPKWRTGQKARREVFSRVSFVSTSEQSRRRHLTNAAVSALPATALMAALCSLPLHTNVTLALCYAGFLSFVLLEDNRILKQDEKDHLSCLADSKPLFVVASLTSCRQGKPTVSQLGGHRGHEAGPVRLL